MLNDCRTGVPVDWHDAREVLARDSGLPEERGRLCEARGHTLRAGLTPPSAPERADLVVVNTCAFIEAARQESVDTILELSSAAGRGEARGHRVPGRALRRRAGGVHARDRPRGGVRRSITRLKPDQPQALAATSAPAR